MKLKTYLQDNELTQMRFIAKVKEEQDVQIPQGTLAKWINGQRIPRKQDMLTIYKATEHLVEPNDFYLGD